MIESQSKLPVQGEKGVAIWARGQKMAASVVEQLQQQERALPGRGRAQYLKQVGSLLKDRLETFEFRTLMARVFRWAGAGIGDGSLVNRFALHFVLVFLALGVVSITQVSFPEVDLLLPTPTPAPELGTHSVAAPVTNRGVNHLIQNNTALFPAPVPHTTIPERDRMQVITYTVQANDNVWSIAQGFGLNAETVLWANPKVEKTPDLLSVGQKLIIPPVNGIWYTVQKGDTLQKLAKTYQTSVEKIVAFEMNGLVEPYTLAPGQQIMLPDGRKKVVRTNYYPMTAVGKAPKGALTGTGRFAWPTQGMLSQRFWSGHLGIDIANRVGVPIRAADAGYVVMSGRDTWGYGNQVVIDHGNGYMTRYAHLNTIRVKAGSTVKKGDVIGTMGSTGRSTGPHLHFEVIYRGAHRNPLGFLP